MENPAKMKKALITGATKGIGLAIANDFTLVGNTTEPKAKVKYEEVFGMDVPYFNKEVVFQQKVKLKKGQTTVKGTVEFMACDADQCLPPDEISFAVPVK